MDNENHHHLSQAEVNSQINAATARIAEKLKALDEISEPTCFYSDEKLEKINSSFDTLQTSEHENLLNELIKWAKGRQLNYENYDLNYLKQIESFQKYYTDSLQEQVDSLDQEIQNFDGYLDNVKNKIDFFHKKMDEFFHMLPTDGPYGTSYLQYMPGQPGVGPLGNDRDKLIFYEQQVKFFSDALRKLQEMLRASNNELRLFKTSDASLKMQLRNMKNDFDKLRQVNESKDELLRKIKEGIEAKCAGFTISANPSLEIQIGGELPVQIINNSESKNDNENEENSSQKSSSRNSGKSIKNRNHGSDDDDSLPGKNSRQRKNLSDVVLSYFHRNVFVIDKTESTNINQKNNEEKSEDKNEENNEDKYESNNEDKSEENNDKLLLERSLSKPLMNETSKENDDEYNKLIQMRDELQKRVEQLENANKDLSNKLEQSQNESKEFQNQLEAMKSNSNSESERLKELENQLAALKQKNEELLKENDKYKDIMHDLDTERRQLRSQINDMEKEKSDILEQLNKTKDDYNALQQQFDQIKSEKDEQEQLIHNLENKVNQLNQIVEENNEKLQQIENTQSKENDQTRTNEDSQNQSGDKYKDGYSIHKPKLDVSDSFNYDTTMLLNSIFTQTDLVSSEIFEKTTYENAARPPYAYQSTQADFEPYPIGIDNMLFFEQKGIIFGPPLDSNTKNNNIRYPTINNNNVNMNKSGNGNENYRNKENYFSNDDNFLAVRSPIYSFDDGMINNSRNNLFIEEEENGETRKESGFPPFKVQVTYTPTQKLFKKLWIPKPPNTISGAHSPRRQIIRANGGSVRGRMSGMVRKASLLGSPPYAEIARDLRPHYPLLVVKSLSKPPLGGYEIQGDEVRAFKRSSPRKYPSPESS
ncbi:hypothetical protein TRFO_39338 [Tritrichomonas foetus]|uniref:Uncharacterized protein n=1 Tax=Tritrichomonas foetus TaxID=1144522 RepID=A0A1J4J5A3_9EUKA|nr:hypothetical protein TRFO_39338 [Tritrichomonas foetus]|eukprot:OHS94438.1 hypothetical protein TRFO_39338 [Tritrichomonas foetus]